MTEHKTPSFADIETEIRNIVDSAELLDEACRDGDGEAMRQQLDDYLRMLAEQEADKADRLGFVLRGLKDKAESLDAMGAEIQRKARSVKRAEQRLRDYILATMVANGLQKVKGEAFTLSARKSAAVQVYDEARLPLEFIEVVMTPMKAEIKKAIQSGQSVPGAALVENTSLMVR